MLPGLSDQGLLSTKLTLPRCCVRTLIPRQYLYSKLEMGVRYPFLLISALAGSGKTTLISEWLRQRQSAAAWVSLEPDDNDPLRFWRYVLAAFGNVYADDTEKIDLCLSNVYRAQIEDMLTELLNILLLVPQDILLVLDDYHHITNATIHHTLEFFLEHLPPHVHLIMITRSDPPLALARLRVRCQISELHMSDLRLTMEETTQLLERGLGVTPPAEALLAIDKLTEGWVAGLQLMMLSLKEQDDIIALPDAIKTFSGAQRHVSAYLTEEILTYLPDDVREFLLLTSIVTTMNVSLCEAITRQKQGAVLLEWLDQSNLLQSTTDEQGNCYRCHGLLSELLYACLKQEYAERLPELHLRASKWYEQHDMLLDAIHHALAASAPEQATCLIEKCAWSLLEQGQAGKICTRLKKLPGSLSLVKRPWLALLYAGYYIYTGQLENYEQTLLLVEQACTKNAVVSILPRFPLKDGEPNAVELRLKWLLLRAYGALFYTDGAKVVQYAQQAQELAPMSTISSDYASVLQGAGYLAMGELEQAHRALARGQSISRPASARLIHAFVYLGDLRIQRGCLHEALELYTQGIAEIAGSVAWDAVLAHCHVGSLYYEWNDRRNAEYHLAQAWQMAEQHTPGCIFSAGPILAARLAWLRGEKAKTMSLLDKAEEQQRGRQDLLRITVLRVQYLLAEGNIDAAHLALQRSMPATEEALLACEKEIWYQAKVRLLMAQQRAAEAIGLLEAVLQTARTQGRTHNEIALQVLLVRAYYATGDVHSTKQTLEQAVMLAQTGGYCRVFLDEGEELAILLAELYHRQRKKNASSRQKSMGEYIQTLLSACGLAAEVHAWKQWRRRTQSPLDQLSEREQAVLKLVAEGYSNQQIAHVLVVAESTIKTHLNNIYTKLHVNSRLQALTKAHAYGLLDR